MAWLLLLVIGILGAIIAILTFMLLRARQRVRPETIYQIPAETTAELGEARQTIGTLTEQLRIEKEERGKDLEVIARRAEEEIAARTEQNRLRLEAQFHELKRTDRQVSNLRSRAALLAKVTEHLGPLIPGFPYPLKEVRHIGEIFDFLVYDGLESGGEISLVFLEVKTSSTGRTRRVTNPRERALRDAIKKGRVRYEVWQPPSAEELSARVAEIIDADSREAITAPPIDTDPGSG